MLFAARKVLGRTVFPSVRFNSDESLHGGGEGGAAKSPRVAAAQGGASRATV